jgi:general secretion pathway protein L
MTTPNLTEPAEFRSTLAGLIAEWRAELAAFAHEKFSRPIGEGTQYVGIAVGESEISVNLVTGEGASEIGRVSRQDDLAARAISALLSTSDRVPRGTTDVAIELPASQVLRPHLSLPAASRATLRRAAFYELERLSPVDPAEVYFDLVVQDGARSRKKADIALRIVKRATVDYAVALCRSAGLSVGAIGFEGDPREADRRHFPVDTAAFLRMRWRRFSVWLLAGLAALLVLLVILAAYWRGAAQADFLAAQVDTAGQRAAIVHHLERDIRDVRAQIEFPVAQKRAPTVIAILSAVTRILPDGTWLTEFAVSDNKVHVQGFSKSPSDLIALIDKSPYFANAQFQASLQSAQDNAEHFDLSFELKQSGNPKRPERR